MTISELAAAMEAKGYKLISVANVDAGYEVVMTDANGLSFTAVLDPITGEQLK